MLGHIPAQRRFEQTLLASSRLTGEAAWVNCRAVLDTRENKPAQRCRARLVRAGKLQVHLDSGDMLRLFSRVVDTVLGEHRYLAWTFARIRAAAPLRGALREQNRYVSGRCPPETLELAAMLCCAAPVDNSSEQARPGLTLTATRGGTVPVVELCEVAFRRGRFSRAPQALYATAADVLR